MDVAAWAFVLYVGIGALWLSAMLMLARRQYETVSLKEALIHLLGWPFVLVVLRLWWVGAMIAAISVAALAYTDLWRAARISLAYM